MKTLAERLKISREESGLTQTELAGKAKLKNQSIIGSLETGHRKNSSHIPAIARALGVEALWLAEGKGKKEPMSEVNPRIALLNKLLEDHPEVADYVVTEAIKNVDSIVKLLKKTEGTNGTK